MNGEALHTKLITDYVENLENAAARVGEYRVIGVDKITSMVLVPNRACGLYLVIPEGFYALITSHGRFVGIWAAGFHWARPWETVSHLVTRQFVVYDTPVKECPTADNVMVEIDVSVVFHIRENEESVKNFVYKLGPERLESMLRAFQEEAVRSMVRRKKYSNIYDLMDTEEVEQKRERKVGQMPETGISSSSGGSGQPSAPLPNTLNTDEKAGLLNKDQQKQNDEQYDENLDHVQQLENTKRSMNEALYAYGIDVYSITITNIHLPAQISASMENATTFDAKNRRQAAEQTYKLLCIADTEALHKSAQLLTEAKAEADQTNLKQQSEQTQMSDQVLADTGRLVADIRENGDAAVLRIKAASHLQVSKLVKEKELELAAIDAAGRAQARTISSEADAYAMTKTAEADAKVAKFEAEALRLMAEAERDAGSKLESKRDYDAKIQHLRALKALALNGKIVVSSSNGQGAPSVVAQIAGAQAGANIMGISLSGN